MVVCAWEMGVERGPSCNCGNWNAKWLSEIRNSPAGNRRNMPSFYYLVEMRICASFFTEYLECRKKPSSDNAVDRWGFYAWFNRNYFKYKGWFRTSCCLSSLHIGQSGRFFNIGSDLILNIAVEMLYHALLDTHFSHSSVLLFGTMSVDMDSVC